MSKPICDKCNVVMTFGRDFGCLSCQIYESRKAKGTFKSKTNKRKIDDDWWEYAVNGRADEWR